MLFESPAPLPPVEIETIPGIIREISGINLQVVQSDCSPPDSQCSHRDSDRHSLCSIPIMRAQSNITTRCDISETRGHGKISSKRRSMIVMIVRTTNRNNVI